MNSSPVSLTATWYLKPGKIRSAKRLIAQLVEEVMKKEPGTLGYNVYFPKKGGFNIPPAPAEAVVFFEIYKNQKALNKHLSGAPFKKFLKQTDRLWVKDGNGNNYMEVLSLDRAGGFFRSELVEEPK